MAQLKCDIKHFNHEETNILITTKLNTNISTDGNVEISFLENLYLSRIHVNKKQFTQQVNNKKNITGKVPVPTLKKLMKDVKLSLATKVKITETMVQYGWFSIGQ